MQAVTITQITPPELETLIENSIKKVLGAQKNAPATVPDFKYIPIQDIFKKRICSKPTFYEHLKRGDFHLYKFGSRSFVLEEEFLAAFHKVKLNNKKG